MQYPLDVLVIGGGAQGFWILETLQRNGYCCHLWETDRAGSGQSAHAEWYMHRGHLFPRTSSFPVPILKPSAEMWEQRFSNAKEPGNSTHFGLPTKCRDYILEDYWSQLDLQFEVVQEPALTLRDDFGVVYKTEESCINAERVFHALMEAHGHLAVATQSSIDVSKSHDGSIIGVSSARLIDNQIIDTKPSIVVLAAGARNAQLLDGVFGVNHEMKGDFQREKAGILLIIRDPQNRLPPETVFAQSNKLFVVSRPVEHPNVERVWIVSEESAWKRVGEGPFSATEEREAINHIWRELSEVSTFVSRNAKEFEFAVVTGNLVSQNLKAGLSNVHRFDSPDNLIAVWPTRVTLAPHWANELLSEVRSILPQSTAEYCRPAAPSPDSFRSKWDRDGFVSWSEFERKFLN